VKRIFAPILFLLLTPAFYVWSVHSSKTPIFVPALWPYSYYNTRYGIAVVLLLAFASGAIVLIIPKRLTKGWLVIPAIALLPWAVHPSRERWICWKESQMNSISRRAWTAEASKFLATHYERHVGILASSGDVPGVFCRAKIGLAETLTDGDGPAWEATLARPDLLHSEAWAIAQSGDLISTSLHKKAGYVLRAVITVPGAPALEIYHRTQSSHD
jgi:hypothetical protein